MYRTVVLCLYVVCLLLPCYYPHLNLLLDVYNTSAKHCVVCRLSSCRWHLYTFALQAYNCTCLVCHSTACTRICISSNPQIPKPSFNYPAPSFVSRAPSSAYSPIVLRCQSSISGCLFWNSSATAILTAPSRSRGGPHVKSTAHKMSCWQQRLCSGAYCQAVVQRRL